MMPVSQFRFKGKDNKATDLETFSMSPNKDGWHKGTPNQPKPQPMPMFAYVKAISAAFNEKQIKVRACDTQLATSALRY